MKKLIDTCVLIYLIDNSNEKKHKIAASWFESIIDNKEYYISIQNLREFAYVSKKKNLLSSKQINDILELFSDSFNVVYDNLDDIKEATKKEKNKYWDAILIETAKRNNIFEIITENEKDFYNEIKTTNIFK